MNGDGVLDFLLTTTDAEIVFTQTDNTLLHGETIKVSQSVLQHCDRSSHYFSSFPGSINIIIEVASFGDSLFWEFRLKSADCMHVSCL